MLFFYIHPVYNNMNMTSRKKNRFQSLCIVYNVLDGVWYMLSLQAASKWSKDKMH